jgi:serine protease DegQ
MGNSLSIGCRLCRMAMLIAAALPPGLGFGATAVPRLAVSQDVQGSGVFLNAAGDVLTAHHVVKDCHSLYVVKDGRVAPATVLATTSDPDLAVLRTPLKPYLSATLAETAPSGSSSIGVFAEAYSVLQRLPDRARLLSNAMTVPGSDGLQLLSGAKPGASGSAVLGSGGLLLGVVVERVAAGPGSSGSRMLSVGTAGGGIGGSTQVVAIPTARIKQFLQEQNVEFSESDVAQLGPMQSPAARAMTLSVGIICG